MTPRKETKPFLPVGNYALMLFDKDDKCVGWETTDLNRVAAEEVADSLVADGLYHSVKVIYVHYDTKLNTWSKKV